MTTVQSHYIGSSIKLNEALYKSLCMFFVAVDSILHGSLKIKQTADRGEDNNAVGAAARENVNLSLLLYLVYEFFYRGQIDR